MVHKTTKYVDLSTNGFKQLLIKILFSYYLSFTLICANWWSRFVRKAFGTRINHDRIEVNVRTWYNKGVVSIYKLACNMRSEPKIMSVLYSWYNTNGMRKYKLACNFLRVKCQDHEHVICSWYNIGKVLQELQDFERIAKAAILQDIRRNTERLAKGKCIYQIDCRLWQIWLPRETG